MVKRMKLINLLSTFILLSGCGTMRALIIEEEFRPYYNEFKEDYGLYPNISIMMADDDVFRTVQIAAHCRKSKPHRVIEVKRSKWDKFTDLQKKIIVYHELGHCLFNRDHVEHKLQDNCPESIMNEFVLSDLCIDRHYEHYIMELP